MPVEPSALDLDDPLPTGAFEPRALGPLGQTLTTSVADDRRELRLEAVFEDPDRLLAEHADGLDGVDARVAAAAWTNRAVTALVPGFLAAWTLADVGVDASGSNLALQLEGADPVGFRVLDPERARRGRPERDRTPATLLGDTLPALVEAVDAGAELPPRVTWANVANIVAYLFDRLDEFGLAGASPEADRAHLLDAEKPAWSTGNNPLQGTIGYEPVPGDEGPERYQVREVCCLKQEIDGKQPCASCPRIDAERRGELLAARRRSL